MEGAPHSATSGSVVARSHHGASMRRELVPIEHLGVAADALGKGRDVPDFAFSGGTREVRNAATAFQTMHLEPGDLQMLCNQTMLHSRTSFEDHADEEKRRTLYRLWLARPDSRRLPKSWEVFYGTAEPGTVRGGFKGHHYDDVRRAFDARQAATLGMRNAA